MGEHVSVGDHIGVGPHHRVRKAASGRHGERPMSPPQRPQQSPPRAAYRPPRRTRRTHQPMAGRDGEGRAHRGRPPRPASPSLWEGASARHDDGSCPLTAADEKGRPRAALRGYVGRGALAMPRRKAVTPISSNALHGAYSIPILRAFRFAKSKAGMSGKRKDGLSALFSEGKVLFFTKSQNKLRRRNASAPHCLDLLGFIRPNRVFSTGYSGKNKKILSFLLGVGRPRKRRVRSCDP
jgi:hypothetical protein